MCIDFYGHHSGGSFSVYVNDFFYYRNCLYTIGTGTALIKNMSMRVPVYSTVYSIDSLMPRTRFGSANQVGSGSGRRDSPGAYEMHYAISKPHMPIHKTCIY